MADSATSAALTPGFFEIDSVTAGNSPSLPPCQTYCEGWSGPSVTTATSDMNTGRPPDTPTTRRRTSAAVSRKVPVSTRISRLPETRLPEGWSALESCSAALMSCAVMPREVMRSESMATRTMWPGPPSVSTSRVPGMRFISISTARATCCISKAERARSLVQKVSVTMGTSSMPFGLMIASPTPRLGETQSRCELTVS